MKITYHQLPGRNIEIKISDNVSIHLEKEEYDDLIRLLIPNMEKEISIVHLNVKSAAKKESKYMDFLLEMENILYDSSSEDCFVRRGLKNIDENKLYEAYKKYSKLF